MRQRPSQHALVVVALLLFSACSDPTEPRAPGADASSSPADLNTKASADDPISLSRTVPGFGGFYLDGAMPVVYLKNTGERENVQRALAPFFHAEGLAAAQLRIRHAKYGWDELERWLRQASTAILAGAGGIFVDADEASNRVVTGVERDAGARIRGLVARLGIPEDAAIAALPGLAFLTVSAAARSTSPAAAHRRGTPASSPAPLAGFRRDRPDLPLGLLVRGASIIPLRNCAVALT